MNGARLARKWREAGGDFNRMAEDLSDEPSESLATKHDLTSLRAELKAEMDGMRSDFRALGADFNTLRAEVKADMAAAEAKLARTLILTQVSGFVALAVLIPLK